MSKINLFLQKIKLHESHHGIVMVIAAYALSFLMLVLGSDVFYNIKAASAGISKEREEETQGVESEDLNKDLLSPRMMNPETLVLQASLINPYGLNEPAEAKTLGQTTQRVTDAVVHQNTEQLENHYQAKMSLIEPKLASTVSIAEDEVEEVEEAVTESLSVEETATPVLMSLTKDEIDMLERIVEAEATGEDMKGKILIANVIFNRMEDDEFPKSIEKVIFQKVGGDYQFSPISDKRFWSVKVTDDTEEAVERALQGEDYSEGALYFMARKRTRRSSARWFDEQLEWLFQHGGHEFYKNK